MTTVIAAATTAALAAAVTVAATATAAATVTTTATAVTIAATATAATTTVTTTAAAAVATTATAAACRAFFTRTCFVDGELAAHEFLAVLRVDRSIHGFCGVHGHEGEPARASALAVHRQEDFGDATVLGEQLTNVLLLSGEGQIAHVHLGIHIFVGCGRLPHGQDQPAQQV